MIETPLLLPTSVGPIAAVLTRPEQAPRAAVYVLQGWACSRSDANQMWTRLARALAPMGVATLRVDYAARGESWAADPHQRIRATLEVGQWFEEQVNGAGLVALGYCYGVTPAAALCAQWKQVLGIAVVNPPLAEVPVHAPHALRAPRAPRSRVQRVRMKLRSGAWRRMPRAAMYRLRFGPAQTWWAEQPGSSRPRRHLIELAQRAPLWILTGKNDVSVRPVEALVDGLDAVTAVQFDVSDVDLRNARTPESQTTIIEGVVSWVDRCLHAHATT